MYIHLWILFFLLKKCWEWIDTADFIEAIVHYSSEVTKPRFCICLSYTNPWSFWYTVKGRMHQIKSLEIWLSHLWMQTLNKRCFITRCIAKKSQSTWSINCHVKTMWNIYVGTGSHYHHLFVFQVGLLELVVNRLMVKLMQLFHLWWMHFRK